MSSKGRTELENNFFGVEKRNAGNRLKRVLAKFCADRSYPRGINGCSKFHKNSTPKTSNGRKIARIAPIWTKLGRNRSQRHKFYFQKFVRDPVVQKLRENCENFRETVVDGVGGMAEPLNFETVSFQSTKMKNLLDLDRPGQF